MKTLIKKTLILLAGIIPSVLLAIVSLSIHGLYKPISAVAIAIIVGLVIRNTIKLPTICSEGNSFVIKRILRLAIILLGVRLSFVEVFQIGGNAFFIVVTCIVLSLTLVQLLSKAMNVSPRLGTLIGVGSSICGNSAIVATAPVIRAEDEETAFAVATITLFGVMAVLFYPIIGHLLGMTDTAFGMWAGTAINDTSQVVTAGFIFNESAGEVATVVKLTRNLLMAPVIIVMSIAYNRRQTKGMGKISIKKVFPLFVLGFVAMAILRTLDVFSPEVIRTIKNASSFLIVMSVAAIGLNTSFASMKKVGLKPFYVGLAASCIMGGLSFVLIRVFGAQ